MGKSYYMDVIRNAVYNNVELTCEQMLFAFQKIGDEGDVVLMKHDGERSDNRFTVVILSPSRRFDSIRLDAESLSAAFAGCLREYFTVLPAK